MGGVCAQPLLAYVGESVLQSADVRGCSEAVASWHVAEGVFEFLALLEMRGLEAHFLALQRATRQ